MKGLKSLQGIFTYLSLLASRSDSSKVRISPSRTGPFTLRMMDRFVSSRNSTHTWKVKHLSLYKCWMSYHYFLNQKGIWRWVCRHLTQSGCEIERHQAHFHFRLTWAVLKNAFVLYLFLCLFCIPGPDVIRCMWVEFVGSLPCSKGFFPGTPVKSPLTKNQHWWFDLISCLPR